MQELKDKILSDGKGIGSEIVKVDSFLNHQIDVTLLQHMGEEFARRFLDSKANKILTVEASGIPIACYAATAMNSLPVVFAKKAAPSTMVDGAYVTDIVSFTKGKTTSIRVSKDFLNAGDKVLIIDDFLASGEAGLGLMKLCEMAGAEVVGFGACIEKEWQGGSALLRERGVHVESLAVITSIEDGNIILK